MVNLGLLNLKATEAPTAWSPVKDFLSQIA